MVGDADFGNLSINPWRQDINLPGTSVHMLAVVARVTGDSGVLAFAESNAVNLLNADQQLPQWQTAANLSLAIVAVERDDKDSAERIYRSLLPVHQYYACPLCSDRVLGLLSQTMENSGQAQIHFEDALVFCRNAGYRPELAWTCFDYADMLLGRNESGDVTKAMSLLDESLAVSTELGMRPLYGADHRTAGLDPGTAVAGPNISCRAVPAGGRSAAPNFRWQDRPGDC